MKGRLKIEKTETGKINVMTVPRGVACQECQSQINSASTCFWCVKTKKFFHVQCIQENHVTEHVMSGDMNETKDLLVKLKIEPIPARNTENTE